MTGRHKVSVLFWGGLVVWMAGALVSVFGSTAHPWDALVYALVYTGSVLMISGLLYQSVLKLREQLSEAEDKFIALLALRGDSRMQLSGSPVTTFLDAGDTLTIQHTLTGAVVQATVTTATQITVRG